MNKFVFKITQTFCISVNFGTYVDLTKILKMQKNILKNDQYLQS